MRRRQGLCAAVCVQVLGRGDATVLHHQHGRLCRPPRSFSGFCDVSNAGTVQLVTLGRVLARQGFQLWDLGAWLCRELRRCYARSAAAAGESTLPRATQRPILANARHGDGLQDGDGRAACAPETLCQLAAQGRWARPATPRACRPRQKMRRS